MTDTDIIKALECCKKDDCDNCPNDFGNCYANLAGYALDLINRQKEELEAVQSAIDNAYVYVNEQKAEAIKEFAERLKEQMTREYYSDYAVDRTLKEMVGDDQ